MLKKSLYSLSLILILYFTGSLNAYSQEGSADKKVNFSSPETWLLGYFEKSDLLTKPHYSWFENEYDKYVFEDDVFVKLSENSTDNIQILIVLGTWCPDSRREVPRFMKIMDAWGFPEESIKFLGVDSYKEAPIDGYDDLGIERVPTFIIYEKKNEAGRIIEYPKASLERDMVDILNKLPN